MDAEISNTICITANPEGPGDPFAIVAPAGLAYQWVRCGTGGVLDLKSIQSRFDSGWSLVPPSAHPDRSALPIDVIVGASGLVLMQKSADAVDAERLRQKNENDAKLAAALAAVGAAGQAMIGSILK